jgi:hypothetical protein
LARISKSCSILPLGLFYGKPIDMGAKIGCHAIETLRRWRISTVGADSSIEFPATADFVTPLPSLRSRAAIRRATK